MNLKVRLFATLKERAGASQVSVEVDEPAVVSDILAALTEKFPAIQPSLQSILVAVNQEYAERTQPIHPGAEIALFPPVSGG
jgi:molybdopterin converting factor subunit 1